MGLCRGYVHGIRSAPATAHSVPAYCGQIAALRQPTDPLYWATLVLQNIVVGSRYWIAQAATGDVLASGTAASTTVTLDGLAAYTEDMLLEIRVRKASSAPRYAPFETGAYLSRGRNTAYVAQIPDDIAQ